MSEHELEKLLAGFAADTLTQEERQKLFTAALRDQQLFNALADEQALKELLADPAVRRRLLQALQQTGTSSAGGSLSWLDWFRRPAGLAFAGGLVAAALGVVLGTKIYQDSLKQAAQPGAVEESKPATPPVPTAPLPAPPASETQEGAKAKAEPPIAVPKKDTLPDKLSVPEEHPATGLARESVSPRAEQEERRKQVEPGGASSGKIAQEAASTADKEQLAKSSVPAAAAPQPAQTQPAATAPLAGIVAPAPSARALFYAGEPGRSDTRTMATENEQAMQPRAEPAPQALRPERKMDRLAAVGKATGTPAQLKPLGLRYSFVIRGSDGLDREVDAATVSKTAGQARVMVEANQGAYLQVWERVGSSTPQLLFPERESGQISVKILVGQPQIISLPIESSPVTLTVRLSRVPFGPITRQEAAMLDRLSPNQLQEAITRSSPTGSQEQATYVVNQDPSPTAQITVEIPLGR